MQLYSTYAALIEGFASNRVVSLLEVIIRTARMVHFIGFSNYNDNNDAFA